MTLQKLTPDGAVFLSGLSVAALCVLIYILISARRNNGIAIVPSGIVSSITDNGAVAGYNAARATLNTLIRGDASLYDALCDFASDPIMGIDNSIGPNPSYWTDNIHPNAAGHVLLKPYMKAAVAAVMA